MQPRSRLATLSLATVLALCSSLFAVTGSGGTGVVVPGNNPRGGGGNSMKGQEQKDLLMRFYESQDVTIYNKKRTMAIFTQLDGSRPVKTVAGGKDPKDPDPDIQTTVDKLQKGDVVKMTLAPWNGVMAIDYIKKIEVKPAEETPHGFVFQESYSDPNNSAETLIRVTKYGESYELKIQDLKDEKGKMQPDPALADTVGKLKMGEPVYIQAAGRPPVISMIFPYKDPQTGKVTKVSQVDVDGGKTSAMDIETDDGKTVTALVPGKMNGKRFLPDSVLMNQSHSLKPGTQVQFTARDDNGKTYLVEIARAPKTSAKPGSGPDNMSNTKTGKAG